MKLIRPMTLRRRLKGRPTSVRLPQRAGEKRLRRLNRRWVLPHGRSGAFVADD